MELGKIKEVDVVTGKYTSVQKIWLGSLYKESLWVEGPGNLLPLISLMNTTIVLSIKKSMHLNNIWNLKFALSYIIN
jgi:hypothetical protein